MSAEGPVGVCLPSAAATRQQGQQCRVLQNAASQPTEQERPEKKLVRVVLSCIDCSPVKIGVLDAWVQGKTCTGTWISQKAAELYMV